MLIHHVIVFCYLILQIKNNITRSMDVFCKTKDLKVYLSVESDTEEFSKLVTIETGEVYNVPLFVAYHLELFMCPADSRYGGRIRKIIPHPLGKKIESMVSQAIPHPLKRHLRKFFFSIFVYLCKCGNSYCYEKIPACLIKIWKFLPEKLLIFFWLYMTMWLHSKNAVILFPTELQTVHVYVCKICVWCAVIVAELVCLWD